MAQTSLFPIINPQFPDNNGDPLAGGKVYFYEPGTTTAKAVYSDSNGTTPLSNPVILDSAGRAKMWLIGFYKVKVDNANDAEQYTEDNVSSQFSAATTDFQYLLQNDALTYVSATQFTVPTDKTDIYQPGNRIKAIVTAGTIYGTITVSASSGAPVITTVTCVWDSGALDSGFSDVYMSVLTIANPSIPVNPVLSKSANYTIDLTDYSKKIFMSSGGVELTIPAANTTYSGFGFNFTNVGANQMTLVGTVNGYANVTFLQNESAALVSDGANWFSPNMHNNDPVGTIKWWHKSLSGVPQTLPWGWMESTGQTISDAESPIDGETLPNINGEDRFIRGNTISGNEQANQNLSHTHAITSGVFASNVTIVATQPGGTLDIDTANGAVEGFYLNNFDGMLTANNAGSTEARPDNVSMVAIIKFK